MNRLKAFIIGSKQLSVDILHILLQNDVEVLGAITRDHEPGMRVWHEKLGHGNLKKACLEAGIPVHEGVKVNSQETKDLLRSLDLDIVFSCFWGEIVRQDVLDIPRLGIFNFHTALLPKNRGSRPIPWAIIRGDEEAGLTLHQMAAGVDNGPMVAWAAVPITTSDTAQTLYEKVTKAGAEMFANEIKRFAQNTVELIPQSESDSTYQPRGEPFGGQINAHWSEEKKQRLMRAFTFPPFRAWRPAPAPSLAEQASVYFIPINESPTYKLPIHAHGWKMDSIGNPSERKQLRDLFGTASKHIHIVNDLQGAYSVHDVLERKGVNAVSSVSQSAPEWKAGFPENQPFRYENGLLEIPLVSIANSDDINLLSKAATKCLVECNRDIFIGIRFLQEFTPTEGLSVIKKLNCGTLSPQQVINHFDTEYEAISS